MRFVILALLALLLPLSACAQDVSNPAQNDDLSVITHAQNDDKTQKPVGDFGEVFGLRRSNTSDGLKLNTELSNQLPINEQMSAECLNAIWAQMLEEIKAKETGQTSPEARAENIPECASVVFPKITCTGVAQQGGAVLCQTAPNAKVKVARSEEDFYFENADPQGRIIIGFDRDEGNNFIEAEGERIKFDLVSREYDISRIDGLPPSQVSTFSETQLKRIRSSSARKKVGFASRETTLGFKNGFISPVKEFRKTTNFGAQRILNGEEKRPHYGVDMAAPVGTPIYAPADGVVSLADDDLYFEGAMVMLDHGQGLISMYLHTDEILVEAGQSVKQGEQIATIGSKGRSTGPHLCWRLKWRNRNLDPELLTQWPHNEH